MRDEVWYCADFLQMSGPSWTTLLVGIFSTQRGESTHWEREREKAWNSDSTPEGVRALLVAFSLCSPSLCGCGALSAVARWTEGEAEEGRDPKSIDR